ncbi:hypothetical protein [Nocardia sp. alder85J]|uniref:hypothetical protein n=1 Tax=Nocardia sp. alder85J TaxID=2862949 RepID=UPI001CD656B7|nr:hypothetical protein [Nocardia sp. alder85J]MCX4095144.1 hypothetical protein [Nocardia sp. alder85J]
MRWGTIGSIAGTLVGGAVGGMIDPFGGEVAGAMMGQALFSGGGAAVGQMIGGMVGDHEDAGTALAHAMISFASAGAPGSLAGAGLAGLGVEGLANGLLSGAVGSLSVLGINHGLDEWRSQMDHTIADRNAGVWIGGSVDDLNEKVAGATAQGFLFQPNLMPANMRTWYASLAALLAAHWRNLGHPDSSGRAPQTAIPSSVSTPPPLTGSGVKEYEITADDLRTSIQTFMRLDNALVGQVDTTKANITTARKNLVTLADNINDSIRSGDGKAAGYESMINYAFNQVVDTMNAAVTAHLLTAGTITGLAPR